jgi:uncharacterized Ntn-hydrolase superfamily protein
MTWSIVARDPATGAFGVAAATKFLAVGALCPHASGGVGALATQALVNPTFGARGLRLLAAGKSAVEIVAALIAEDDGRAFRQLHLQDAEGGIAAHSGAECPPWSGHRIARGFSVSGNTLAGPEVVDATAAAYEAGAGLAFGERLIRALEAGEAAGGDKRGRQSAALRVHTSEEHPYLDLRVDDHPEPLVELRRLYGEARRTFLPYMHILPTRADPAGTYDRAAIEAMLPRSRGALLA